MDDPADRGLSRDDVISMLDDALGFWQDYDLSGQMGTFEEVGASIAQAHDDSLAMRKELAAKTKAFKAHPRDEWASHVPSLMREYQGAIEALTKRAKAAERAFVSTYNALAEAPDPASVLADARDLLGSLSGYAASEAENARLHDRVAELEAEFAGVKNQEVTIQRLEKELRAFEGGLDDRVDAMVAAREAELRADFATKETALAEREALLRSQTQRAEEQLARLQASAAAEGATRFDASELANEEAAMRARELELLTADLERARRRAVDLETQLVAATSGAGARAAADVDNHLARIASLEVQLAQRDVEIDNLLSRVADLNDKADAARRRSMEDIDALRGDVRRLEAEATRRDDDLRARPSAEAYEALLDQVRLLRATELGLSETGSRSGDGWGDSPVRGEPASLEERLVAKNKHLQHLITTLNKDVAAKQGRISELEAQLEAAEAREGRNGGGGGGGGGGANAAGSSGGSVDDLAISIEGTTAGSRPAGAERADALTIMTSRRDYYKEKVNALEVANQRLGADVRAAREDVRRLETDNVQLYEKIKYLENYDDIVEDMERGASAGARKPLMGGGGGDVEARYRPLYEQSLDPFTHFRRKQRTKQVEGLNAAERVTLTTSKFLLSSKKMRMFLFVYSVVLHMLVFSVLFMGTNNCHVGAADAAAGFAQNVNPGGFNRTAGGGGGGGGGGPSFGGA